MSCALVISVVVLSGCGSQVPPGQFVGDGPPAAAVPVGDSSVPVAAGATPTVTGAGVPIPGGPSGTTVAGAPGGSVGASAPVGQQSPVGAISTIPPGNCAGFRNSTGITNSTIAVGNVSDLSGPVPGIFTSAQQATRAYAAYFNSTSTICGRKLAVNGFDSQTSAIGDQQGATSACEKTFAMVGSVSAFDNGGAKAVSDCGVPDLRAILTTPDRAASGVSFGTASGTPNQVSTVQYRAIKSLTGTAYRKTAVLYLDAGAAVPQAKAYIQTMKSLGYNILYSQAIDVTALSYASYAAKLKSNGVTLVQFEGAASFAARLKQAMDAQDVHPVFVMDSVAYDPTFVASAGADLDGMYTYTNTAMLEEAGRNPQLRVYETWLNRVAPGAEPTYYGMFAWSAMALFTQLASQLGGRLSRANFLTALKTVHSWTAGGVISPQDVGAKRTGKCQTVMQLSKGTWVRRTPYPYSCSDVFTAS